MSFQEREAKRKNKGLIGSMLDTDLGTPENAKSNTAVFSISKKETRSKKVSLLVQPSVLSKVQEKCKTSGISVNELINQFLIKIADQDIEVILEKL